MVGFRSGEEATQADPDGVILKDGNVQYVYLHDDNLGPSVRFQIADSNTFPSYIELIPSAPEPLRPQDGREGPCANYGHLRPAYLVAAIPNDLRISPDTLHKKALKIVVTAACFFYMVDYLGLELAGLLGDQPEVLAAARMALVEKVAPMSRILRCCPYWHQRTGTCGRAFRYFGR